MKAAKERAALYNDPTEVFGTVGYWLDRFIVNCTERVKAKTLAPRTLSDYTKNVQPLKTYLGAMLPEHIQAQHVQSYIDLGAEAGRAVRANREVACLSSCLSWLIRTGKTALQVNPCMQASGTKKNSESKRERYVTHEEYREVYAAAGLQVQMLMELTYRTLQRPESDILSWTPTILTRDAHTQQRVLEFVQGKTGTRVKIAMTERLELLVLRAMGVKPIMSQPLVHTRTGDAYSYTGIMSMLTRTIAKVNRERKAKGVSKMSAFAFQVPKSK
ncbi:MAG: integrase, partial [Acidovorax sp.]|nr:integrase [Acidovorax sp.]